MANQIFQYGGFHFTPVRKFRKNEAECVKLRMDMDVKLYQEKNNWNYNEFYKKSGNSKADIFRCVGTRNYYIPTEGGLWLYLNYN